MGRTSYRTPTISRTTRKGVTKQISFKKGVYNYRDNDDIAIDELYAAIDARMIKIGRYKTRRGLDRFSVPVGETVDAAVTSTAGASTAIVNSTLIQAQKLTTTAAGHITKVTVKVGAMTAVGTLLVRIYSDNTGSPGTLLGTSSFRRSGITSTQTDIPVYFVGIPSQASSTDVWVVIETQESASGDFLVSTTTSATTAKTGTPSGTTWAATSYALNVSLYITPHQPVLGLIRVNRPNGVDYTFFAAGQKLYEVNESTGATSVIKDSMSSSATKYRFEVVQDALYWVNGYEKPYKYDFTTVTQLTACPMNPDLITENVGLLFVAREDDSKMHYSNFAEYDIWTSTDFGYMLAPKTPFTMRAFAKLNGVFYSFARKNKYQLLGEDNDTFSPSEALSQRGTFSQESLVYDDNTIYHADEDGIWAFNGSAEKNLAMPFLEEYKSIPNKDTLVLEKWNNRLYAFFTSPGGSVNDSCFVMNLALDLYESLDTNTYVGRAFARKDADGMFLQASNLYPAIFKGEDEGNDYHNLGGQLQYALVTAFSHFDVPGQFKQCPMWRPEVVAADGNYSLQCSYAYEMSETVSVTKDLPVGASSIRWDSGWLWDDGTHYATTQNSLGRGFYMSGDFRRVQRKYWHTAAREPVEFDSEMLAIEIQEMF